MKNIDFNSVADLYDAYVSADFDIEFFKRLALQAGGKCLELMCGTGRVSLPLLEHGVDLTCVDYSEEMLKVFAQKAKELKASPRIECQDVCGLSLDDAYRLIFIPFNSFSEIVDGARQEAALARIYDHLEVGGSFICTLYNPAYRVKTADGQLRILGRFPLDNNKSLVVSYYNQYSEETKKVTGIQFYEIYDRENKLEDKRYMDICFSLICKEAFLEMTKKAGFTVKAIYGDYNFTPFSGTSSFMNFILEK